MENYIRQFNCKNKKARIFRIKWGSTIDMVKEIAKFALFILMLLAVLLWSKK